MTTVSVGPVTRFVLQSSYCSVADRTASTLGDSGGDGDAGGVRAVSSRAGGGEGGGIVEGGCCPRLVGSAANASARESDGCAGASGLKRSGYMQRMAVASTLLERSSAWE